MGCRKIAQIRETLYETYQCAVIIEMVFPSLQGADVSAAPDQMPVVLDGEVGKDVDQEVNLENCAKLLACSVGLWDPGQPSRCLHWNRTKVIVCYSYSHSCGHYGAVHSS